MLVHKGGQINNVQLITGLRIAEMYNYKIAVSSVQRMEVIVKMLKREKKSGWRGGMCTKNGSYCEKEKSQWGGSGWMLTEK